MNGRYEGKTYGIPFQRSTQVLYWNKAAFKEAGLDPNQSAGQLGRDRRVRQEADGPRRSGKVTRWGLIVPSGVTSHWFLQGFTTQNRAKLTNDAGTETYLATPEAIESLQYFVDLSRKHKIMQEGIIDTGTAPNVFIEGRAAMMFHSTGNLTNVKNNAKFDFGVAMLPARKQRGSATGGGSIYIFKKSTPEQLDASYKFVKWMTSAEQAARWSIATGYVAPRQDAWDLPVDEASTRTIFRRPRSRSSSFRSARPNSPRTTVRARPRRSRMRSTRRSPEPRRRRRRWPTRRPRRRGSCAATSTDARGQRAPGRSA